MADPEAHPGDDRDSFFEIRPAKTFRPHQFAGNADGDGQSGQIVLDETRQRFLPSLCSMETIGSYCGPRRSPCCMACGSGCSGVDTAFRNEYTPSPAATATPAARPSAVNHVGVRLFDELLDIGRF